MTIVKIIVEILLFIMLLIAISTFLGCHMPTVDHSFVASTGGTTSFDTVTQTIRQMDFLRSLLMLGFVLGLIGAFGMGFPKLGLSASGACFAGLFLASAMANVWFYVGAGLIVLASVVIVVAGIALKNRAIRELVIGIQKVKENSTKGTKINQQLRDAQTKTTVAVVNEVKAKLKTRGIL